MEFLILFSNFAENREREIIVMQAVFEASENLGINHIEKRRSDVYSIGVYLKDDRGKSLLYIDWGKNWSWKRVYHHIMSLIQSSPTLPRNNQICLKIKLR